MTLFTIGFTHRSAEAFFSALINAKVKRLIDVRLNNTSQLAGFAKRGDLPYFLRTIAAIEYRHFPQWAPTKEILDGYKRRELRWDEYERRFIELLRQRRIEADADRALLDGACLLCSEPKPDRCHRRLVVEYLREHSSGLEICHL
jgi:uncharacterized protein (DUF488 family)